MASPDITRIKRDATAEIMRQLDVARRRIMQQLRTVGSEAERNRLRALQREVDKHLDAWRRGAVQTAAGASASAIESGVGVVSGAIKAAGIDLMPRINPAALRSLEVALTDLVTDVSLSAKNRINSQIAQVLIGTQGMSDAITAVDRILDGPTRSRARTIVQTELGRIHSAATQAGMEEAAKRIPMKKEWMRSGRKHPREEHQAAHGQVREVNEPFDVGGERLMYPRDPKASAKNTVNCGCRHRPKVDVEAWINMEDLPPARAADATKATTPAAPAMQPRQLAASANKVQVGGIAAPNIVQSPGGILAARSGNGGGMDPPMPADPPQMPDPPPDEHEVALRAMLGALTRRVEAVGAGVTGSRRLATLFRSLDSYSKHVSQRIKDAGIADGDELAAQVFAVLAAAELVEVAVAPGEWNTTGQFTASLGGWRVLMDRNGNIVTAFVRDPAKDDFATWNARYGYPVRALALSQEDRALLARLFARP